MYLLIQLNSNGLGGAHHTWRGTDHPMRDSGNMGRPPFPVSDPEFAAAGPSDRGR